jgi:hypothetical protein
LHSAVVVEMLGIGFVAEKAYRSSLLSVYSEILLTKTVAVQAPVETELSCFYKKKISKHAS